MQVVRGPFYKNLVVGLTPAEHDLRMGSPGILPLLRSKQATQNKELQVVTCVCILIKP